MDRRAAPLEPAGAGGGPEGAGLGFDHGSLWPPRRLIGAGLRFALGAAGRRGGVVLADQMVASGTNFLTTVIIGRNVASEQFGLYTLGFTLVLSALSGQTALITSPYMVYSPRLEGCEQAQYTGSTLIHQVGLSVLCAVCLLAVGVILSMGVGPQGLAPVILALALAAPFILFRDYARGVCFARLHVWSALILDACVAVIQIGGLLALARLKTLSAPHAFLVIALACGPAAIVWLVAGRRLFVVNWRRAVRDLWHNWALGKWVLGTAVARQASSGIFPWLVAAFRGTGAAGAFAACCGVAMFASPFLMAMANFLGPTVAHVSARGGRRQVGSVVYTSTVLILAVTSLFFVAMVAWGGRLVALVYGSQYAGYGFAVSLLAFSVLLSSLTLSADAGLLASERPDAMMKSNLAGACVSLLFGAPAVWAYGIAGAAAADAVKTLVTTGVRLRFFWAIVIRPAKAP